MRTRVYQSLLTVLIVFSGGLISHYALSTPQIFIKNRHVPIDLESGVGLVEVKNIGNSVLTIESLATSCSCAKAKIQLNRIEPGESTNVVITVEGSREAIIALFSNDPENPRVFVELEKPLRASL